LFRRQAEPSDVANEKVQVLQPEELRKILGSSAAESLPAGAHYTLVRTYDTTTPTTTASPAATSGTTEKKAAVNSDDISNLRSSSNVRNRFAAPPEVRAPRQPSKLRVFRREAFDRDMLKEMTRAHAEFEFGHELLEHQKQEKPPADQSSSGSSKHFDAQVAQMQEMLDGLQQLSAKKSRFRREAFEPSMLKEMTKAADEFEFADELVQ
jgi:hypothetical protein